MVGGYNKVAQTGRLKQQKFIFSQGWSLNVQDQDVGRAGVSPVEACSETSPLGLQMAAFFVCVPMLLPLNAPTWYLGVSKSLFL